MSLDEFVRLKMLRIRKLANLTQKDFAQITGIPYYHISRNERALRPWYPSEIERVCQSLQIDLLTFFQQVIQNPPDTNKPQQK